MSSTVDLTDSIKDYRFTSAVMAGLDGACGSTLYTQMAEDMRFAHRIMDDEDTLATRDLKQMKFRPFKILVLLR